ncbi:MAG TPA: hypothetical protein VGG19_11415 [Tepidisphaeraceae bacterium]
MRFIKSVVESLEFRCLKSTTVSTDTTDSLTDLSGAVVATLQVGDNNQQGGAPGEIIATNGSETASSDVEWCSDESNGFDSGLQNFQFAVGSGTSGIAALAAGSIETTSSSAGGTFSQVTISASVDGYGMAMQFQNLVVNFYNGTTLLGSSQIGSLGVDTTNADTNDPEQSIASISINASNCTSVVISGQMEMSSDAGVYPGETDINGVFAVS